VREAEPGEETGEEAQVREGPRERLLGAVLEYVVARGVGSFSLREVAEAVGTSHRMLIYHFGSREGLLVAIVQAVEAAQRAFMAELTADPEVPAGEIVRRMWRRLADPALGPNERLFFELYGQALQGRPGTTGLLEGIVDSWVEPVAADAGRLGLAPETVRADARLGVAVMRGLLLDLLATGDRPAVDAALERYVRLVEAAGRHPESPPQE
jgi:AcrR family transcriptional regulator